MHYQCASLPRCRAIGILTAYAWLCGAMAAAQPIARISTFSGIGVPGYNGDNQAAGSTQLNQPRHLAFSVAGNLYLVSRVLLARRAHVSLSLARSETPR